MDICLTRLTSLELKRLFISMPKKIAHIITKKLRNWLKRLRFISLADFLGTFSGYGSGTLRNRLNH